MVSLETASREELVALIVQQQEAIARLEARIRELEQRPGSGGPRGMPGIKPTEAPPAPSRGRRRRPHGFTRTRSTPTAVVEHAVEECPSCHIRLVGGSVKRRREVIEVAPAPVEVTEHRYLERRCPGCGRRWVPKVALEGVVLGRQRLGVGLVALIVTLAEEGRLPLRTIQWYLQTLHQLHLSRGELVAARHRVAGQGQSQVAQIQQRVQAGRVVHADETGWRENGRNRYVWTFSTPSERYFVCRGRNKGVVDEVLGDRFDGVLVTDFYAAYNHYPGLHQRCWAHVLRDIHELKVLYPEDGRLERWAARVHQRYREAVAFSSPGEQERLEAKRRFERRLLTDCKPFLADEGAVQRRLCLRIQRFLSELFVFVAQPEVPADNNAAERSLRHLVISRKISGGSRSPVGTATKMALNTLYGTWRAQRQNPLAACRNLLLSPQD